MGHYRISLADIVTAGADIFATGKEPSTDCTTAPAEYPADYHEESLCRSREGLPFSYLPWPVIIDPAILVPVVTEASFIKMAPAETMATTIQNLLSTRDRDFTDIAHLGLLSG